MAAPVAEGAPRKSPSMLWRIVLGLFVAQIALTALFVLVTHGRHTVGWVTLGLSAGAVALGIGRSKVRGVIALVLSGLSLALQAAVLLVVATGLDTFMQSRQPTRADLVTGVKIPYTIQAPSDDWKLRPPALTLKENPLADRWLWNVDHDAHVLIIAEETEHEALSIAPFLRTVIGNARAKSPDYQVIEVTPLSTPRGQARLVHARSHVNGMEIEYLTGLVTDETRGYQIMSFCRVADFDRMRGDMLRAIQSFKLPPQLPQSVVTRVPVTSATGERPGLPWKIDAPTVNWRLERRSDTNSVTDTVLMDLISGARIMILTERTTVRATAVRLAEIIVDNARKVSTRYEILGQEAITGSGADGQLVSSRGTVNGIEIEYLIGAFVRDYRLYQVITFAAKEDMPAVRAELKAAIASFRVPADKPKP